jgi:hypothetical protein
VKRRLSATLCAFGVLLSLWVAAAHWHELAAPRTPETAGCVYCVGGMIAAPTVDEAPICIERVQLAEREDRAPVAPQLRFTLPLEHSGNAPPA